MDQTWQPYNLETYSGGVSSAVSPDLLPPNQTAWGMNVDFRGTKVHTRPNIHQRMYLPSGLVQGVGYFNLQGGMLVAMIDGFPYRIRIGIRNSDFSFEPIVLPFYNSPIIKQVWMCQTVESFIIQDGQSDAIIYDGSTARRADRLKTEVPIGLQMAYGNGRLWVAIEGNQLVAGDIRTADAGTELLFTETQYLSGGGALVFPDNITGLSFIPVTGTSDYGALVALGRNYVDTVRADITQRDSWASYPGFVTNAMRNVGSPSGWTLVQVNQDLMWRDALGGIRSLNTSLSNAYYAQYRGAQSDANVPISREVSRLVEFDSQQLLGFSSGIYFDNRLLMTSSPFLNTQGGVSHRDLISLDFAPVSTMQGQSPPAYNGTWQGVDWTQLVKGEFNGQTRAFGISSDQDGFNRLWEFDSGQVDDVYISDGLVPTDGTALPIALSPIECFVEYPRIDFGEPKRRKRITRCDVWMSNLTGKVDLQVYWRPDNNQKWTLWDETSHCAIMQDAATTTPHVWKNLLPEQRPLVKSFSIDESNIDDVTTYSLATGFGFQIRLAWTGSARIERVALWAQAVDSTDYVEREGQEPTCITNDVTGNELRYEIPMGGTTTPPKNVVTTIAGASSGFNLPFGVASDTVGNVYVADTYNQVIRRITPGGAVSILAGVLGATGSNDGAALSAKFNYPIGIAFDPGSGNIYVGDSNNYTIRKITPDGTVSTLAGLAGFSGYVDGTGSAARFANNSKGLTIDGAGNIYLCDVGNVRIRKITPFGVVSTYVDLSAGLSDPSGLVFDPSGTMYIADANRSVIFARNLAGLLSVFAGGLDTPGYSDGVGTGARFTAPDGVGIDLNGVLYVSDSANQIIRAISLGGYFTHVPSGTVTTLAGMPGVSGLVDGVGSSARFYNPAGVCSDGRGNVYVADFQNSAVRKLSSG